MSHDILIDPELFIAEVDEFKESTAEISSVKTDDVMNAKEQSILDAVDELLSIVQLYQTNVEQYIALADKDVAEMNSLKNKWVTKDENLSNEINKG